MASYTISLPAPAKHLSLSHSSDHLAVLLSDPEGTVQVYDLHTRLPAKGQRRGGGKAAEPELLLQVKTTDGHGARPALKQICIGSTANGACFAILDNSVVDGGSTIVLYEQGREVVSDQCREDIQRIVWDAELGYLLLEESGVLSSCKSSASQSCFRYE
jgi:hypothetical protein